MMIGESNRHNPTVHVPPWPPIEDPTAHDFFPDSDPMGDYSDPHYNDSMALSDTLAVLQRYLPSNNSYSDIGDVGAAAGGGDIDSDSDASGGDAMVPPDAFSSDGFRMFEFKVRRCGRARSHDWTDCPYAHPGEKARRRDPRRHHYSGAACPEFRRGGCRRGDSCEFAHGVFECWLHPSRYRTQPCKDGTLCRRRVCFFAHTPDQLRVLSPRNLNQPQPHSNPLSISPPMTPPSDSVSPPVSPLSRSLGSTSVNEMMASIRNLQLSRMKTMQSPWVGSPGFGSPRGGPMIRPGSYSLPSTPTCPGGRTGSGRMRFWEEEEPTMERVESGRDLRARMVEKLSKESSMDRANGSPSVRGEDPDVGWVSELVK